MPLLSSEPNLFPSTLLDDGTDANSRPWWAIYTMSRQEKELMRRLSALQVPFYCPIVSHRYRSPAGRARTSYLPLFTNYVFINADNDQRYRAVCTGCVSKTLPIDDPVAFVGQIRNIRRMIDAGCHLTIESKLVAGDWVRVKSGPLTGLEGEVIERRGERRLLVALNFLQQGASVAMDDWELERL